MNEHWIFKILLHHPLWRAALAFYELFHLLKALQNREWICVHTCRFSVGHCSHAVSQKRWKINNSYYVNFCWITRLSMAGMDVNTFEHTIVHCVCYLVLIRLTLSTSMPIPRLRPAGLTIQMSPLRCLFSLLSSVIIHQNPSLVTSRGANCTKSEISIILIGACGLLAGSSVKKQAVSTHFCERKLKRWSPLIQVSTVWGRVFSFLSKRGGWLDWKMTGFYCWNSKEHKILSCVHTTLMHGISVDYLPILVIYTGLGALIIHLHLLRIQVKSYLSYLWLPSWTQTYLLSAA